MFAEHFVPTSPALLRHSEYMLRKVSLLISVSALLFAPRVLHAQYDVNASLYGQFSNTVSGNGITQSSDSSVGVMLGLRKYERPWRGYEISYSYNRPTQNFNHDIGSVPANSQFMTANYVVSLPLPVIGLRPFVLAGGGAALFGPQGGGVTNTEGVFTYGAGLDYRLIPHVGLRLQYRGLIYNTPDLGNPELDTGSTTHASQALGGMYFKF
jgi:opacity protein-like surface antigen